MSARAYLPPLQRFYESPDVKVNVSDGKVIWEEVMGTPAGQRGPSSQRRFSLLTYRDTEKTELYVRVRDEETGGVYATFSLGSVILFHLPQAAIGVLQVGIARQGRQALKVRAAIKAPKGTRGRSA